MNLIIAKADADALTGILGRCGLNTNGPGFGPAAIKALVTLADAAEAGALQIAFTAGAPTVHHVIASTFADPNDVAAFVAAKKRGLSDEQAFKVGDNGVGYWDNNTKAGSGPQCALPPEDWRALPHPYGTHVKVTVGGKTAVAALGDTMPHRADITNGCGLDMNPDLCALLGVKPGGTYPATWEWA